MDTLRTALDALGIAPRILWENLTVFPLTGAAQGRRRYLTLDEALASGAARITEVGDAGHVPELWLYNDGELPILLLDGEELKGAKQNRVLNLTILAPARGKIVIPVSCVEQGRWHARSTEFASSKNVMYAFARRAKMEQVSDSLAADRGFAADQLAVWDELARKADRLGANSRTGAMDDTYRHAERRIEDYVRAIRPVEGQVGAVFAVDGRVAGCEVFDHPETLARLLPKLVRSYALDAIEAPRRESAEPVPHEAARAFLDEVGSAVHRAFRGIGLGETVRIRAPRLTGAALVEAGALLHLSAFRADDRGIDDDGPREPEPRDDGGRMARWSMRRLWRG